MVELTPSQQEAVETTDRSCAVIASAGSGKTRVLTEHYAHLVKNNLTPHHKILAFTFTEKAAGEIIRRINNEKIIAPEDSAMSQIGTFHSFCYQLLKKYGSNLGLSQFTMMTEAESLISSQKVIAEFIAQELKSGRQAIVQWTSDWGYKKVFQILHQLLTNQNAYLLWALTENLSQLNSSLENYSIHFPSLIANLIKQYEAKKISSGKLNFDDLEYLTLKLLMGYPQVLKAVQMRYEHILVDEFQDLSPIQGRILNLLWHCNHLFIVGDPKQSIYRFRNANIHFFEETQKQILKIGGKKVPLAETFRMGNSLCLAINRIFEPLFSENGGEYLPLTSQDASGHINIIYSPKTDSKINIETLRREEANLIAKKILEIKAAVPLNQIALLFKTSDPMGIYHQVLTANGIPCKIKRTTNLFDVPSVRDLIHILKYLSGHKNQITVTGILNSVFVDLSPAFIERFFKSGNQELTTPFILDLFTSESDKKKWEFIHRSMKTWSILQTLLPPMEFVIQVTNDLCHYKKCVHEAPIQQFLELLTELNEHLAPDENLISTVCQIQDTEIDHPTLPDFDKETSVQLMTIHAAKGLEFQIVYLPQLYAKGRVSRPDFIITNEGHLHFKDKIVFGEINGLKPNLSEDTESVQFLESDSQDNRDEQKRLLYVAMTRAKEELNLFLKEPSKPAKSSETADWNDWLWQALKNEKKESLLA